MSDNSNKMANELMLLAECTSRADDDTSDDMPGLCGFDPNGNTSVENYYNSVDGSEKMHVLMAMSE
eukprot:6557346-Ditylum_brightwellii.AAC.1